MTKSKYVNLARGLRYRQTEAEKKLWSKLRSSQFDGIKFRRQEPIGSYIVDFVSFDNRLIIEIDGGQHNQQPTMEKDEQRTLWLMSQGFYVMRFWDNEALVNIEGVLAKIKEYLDKSHPHLTSPIKGEVHNESGNGL